MTCTSIPGASSLFSPVLTYELLYGLTVAFSSGMSRWLGWFGAVAGTGWTIGALIVSFEVIVPFTVWRRSG